MGLLWIVLLSVGALLINLERIDAAWTRAVFLDDEGVAVADDIGEEAFNTMFEECPVVRYVRNGDVMAVYLRKSPACQINAYQYFTTRWSKVNNELHTDFELYDTLVDLEKDEGKWQFCNYMEGAPTTEADVGFPRDCGKNQDTNNRWFVKPNPTRPAAPGISRSVGFEIFSGPGCPAPDTALRKCGGGGICFSSLSHVTLANHDKIPVPQLKSGDHINSVNSNGDVISSPFLGWLHHNENVTTTFLDITTETGNSISISPLHLLMVTDNVDEKPSMKFANTVGVGDYLLSGGSGLVQVKSVTSQVLTGVYAPLTSTGTVLVDDLLASCYAHIGSHHLAHLAALPARIFPQILEAEGGMRHYLESAWDVFLKFADPLTNSDPTDYVTTFLIAGLMPLAFLRLKM